MSKSDTCARAPWRSRFDEHAPVSSSPLLSFATVSRNPDGNGALPRVRTCVFRGYFANLELHPSAVRDLKAASASTRGQEAEEGPYPNPPQYESDLLTITTDARSEKIGHIMASDDGEIGGPVECLFWSPKHSSQWRMKGKAFIIGRDSSDPLELRSREEVGKWIRLRKEKETNGGDLDKPWSWEAEITTQFANLSPGMKNTFRQDLPGAPRSGPPPISPEPLNDGEARTDLHEPLARKNFRVLVVKPEEVEYIHDEGPGNKNNERFLWKLMCSSSVVEKKQWYWKEEELWP